MTRKKIGALTIGQSPRPDLVAPLLERMPPGYELIQAGALDGLAAADLPPVEDSRYPLTTRLVDGSLVMVEERFLEPRLIGALKRLEREGVAATILLCAGTFGGVVGERPLFKPFSLGKVMLENLGMGRVGFITPIPEQIAPVRKRWQTAGFSPIVWAVDLSRQNLAFTQELQHRVAVNRLDCIVLDYVGHPTDYAHSCQERAGVPVIDLGQLAMHALVATL